MAKMSLNLQTLSGHILTATSQFSCYLPTPQKMIDSFKINYDGATTTTTTPIPPASSPPITTAHPSSDELSTDHSSSSSSSGQLPGIIFFLIIVSTCPVIIAKIRGNGRRKYKERRGFPDMLRKRHYASKTIDVHTAIGY